MGRWGSWEGRLSSDPVGAPDAIPGRLRETAGRRAEPRRRLSIGAKITLGVGGVLLLFIGAGMYAQSHLQIAGRAMREVTEVYEPIAAATYEMEINTVETGLAVLGYLHDRHPRHLERVRKDADDFQRFLNAYNDQVITEEARALGLKVAVAYERFHNVALRLITLQDMQDLRLAILLRSLQHLDDVIDDEIVPKIDRAAPHAGRQHLILLDLENEANEVARGVLTFLRNPNGAMEVEIADDLRQATALLTDYERLPLSAIERRAAGQLRTTLRAAAGVIGTIVELERSKKAALADFLRIREQIDDILDDEIQIHAQRGLTAAKAAAASESRTAATGTLAGLLLAIVLGASASAYTVTTITGPVRTLAAGAVAVGQGDLAHRVSVRSGDELGDLADAFNNMASARQQAEQELQAQHRTLQTFTEALQEAKETADQANRSKSHFLSRMSHELRTPLNVILGFGQILTLDPLSPSQREPVEHILQAGRHLLNLIDEVLEISRIDSDQLGIILKPVDLARLMREASELIQVLAGQLALTVAVAERPRWVLADPQRLLQVLLNLATNAIKYNRPGGTVSISCEDVGTDRVRILVADTGWGIPPEKLSLLFAPFERLGAEHTDVEGTGLGLALSKRLVEAMAGTIGVQSTVGQGSTFWVELSRLPGHEDALRDEPILPDPTPPHGERGRTVVYIEDSPTNIKVVESALAHRGIHVIPALQGRLGLDLASRHTPDLVLIDVHLPDIPGEEVVRRLRAAPETRHIPLIAVSADATTATYDRMLAAGVSDFLTKPLDLAQLFRVIDQHTKADTLAPPP